MARLAAGSLRRRPLTTGSEQVFAASADGSEDDSFQKLLLAFSNTASQAISSAEVLKIFCGTTRAYFQVSGAYVWQTLNPSQMIGAEADGWMADRFRNARLSQNENAIANQSVSRKKAIYFNAIHSSADPMAAEYGAQSMLAVPLMIHNEVIGSAVFLHTTDPHFFNPDHLAKASILAAQLGSFLEAVRLSEQAREEQRRAGILAEVAHSLHSQPDLTHLVQAVADHLRALLRSPLVCILVQEHAGYELWAVAAKAPEAAASLRQRFERTESARKEQDLHFASDLANRAVTAGELITASVDPGNHSLSDLVPPGTILAAPFRTSGKQGAVLVFPRREDSFSVEEKALLPVITSFAAVAISNAELYAKASAQAHELHQILSIAAELGSSSDLEQFMQKFVLRASDFLGFGRAFVGLIDDEKFQVRWSFADGKHGASGFVIPEGILTRAMRNKEVLWADDVAGVPGANQPILAEFNVHQLLAVPLLGVNGEVLGIFGVLDRLDKGSISPEDIRRAQALAAQGTVALEVSRNLLLSEQHRSRAESLTNLALQVSSLLRGPEFSARFVERAATMMQARGAALVVENGGEPSVVPGLLPNSADDQLLWNTFSRAVMAAISAESQSIVVTTAEALLGPELASRAGWEHVILARLEGSEHQIVGALCLIDRAKVLSDEDRQLLQAVAGHASVSLENNRFFTRLEQANRHWIEIFDAISDFIVAHDESGNILRVNRSLAEFIGVQPQQLIGLNMGALLATGISPPSRSCPFCRSNGSSTDEYVHPVLERTYLVSTSQVHAASSEGLQTIHVLKDITDRREAERRYRELFDNIQEGLFFSSPDGRFIEVNDALVRMLGHASRDELLHCDPREEVFPRPERHRDLFALMERQGTLRNREEVLRRKDGGAVHVLINAFAVRDAQGNVVQYRGLMLDISGLKAYQSELQRERDFSGKILNNTQSLILVSDTAGLISYANRRWQALGYEQHTILGQPLENLVAPAKRAALQDAFSAVLAGRQVDNLELQVLRADGRILQFSVNLSPMRDDLAQVTSIVVVMSDITDAASLQAKLMHAEKMAAVGQLVSGVAHEVNNPLTAILGFADLLMENQELPESARKDVRVILQEAQRTKQIVQNLLSFARQMPPQRKPVQINAILKRTIQLRAYDFHSRGVAVTESYDDALPFVIGDSQQLQQVFLNILNNAYDAVRESATGPRIEISTRSNSGFVEVAFSDNGHGITHPDRIFDPFFTTKEVGEGTGLGLSICYGIVKEHGGEILCANNADGAGATFTVRFPSVSEMASLSAVAGVTQP